MFPSEVKFHITRDQSKQQKVVDHGRLIPVRNDVLPRQPAERIVPALSNRNIQSHRIRNDLHTDIGRDHSDSSD